MCIAWRLMQNLVAAHLWISSGVLVDQGKIGSGYNSTILLWPSFAYKNVYCSLQPSCGRHLHSLHRWTRRREVTSTDWNKSLQRLVVRDCRRSRTAFPVVVLPIVSPCFFRCRKRKISNWPPALDSRCCRKTESFNWTTMNWSSCLPLRKTR